MTDKEYQETITKVQKLLTEAKNLIAPISIFTANKIENVQSDLFNKTN